MRFFSCLFLTTLCAAPGCCFEGTCLRKEPPPGVLVLPPGTKLFLSCKGQVKVNGVKVTLSRDDPTTTNTTTVKGPDTTGTGSRVREERGTQNTTGSEGSSTHPVSDGESVGTGDEGQCEGQCEGPGLKGYIRDANPQAETPSPALAFLPSAANSRVAGAEEPDSDGEGAAEARVTRAVRNRPQWRWRGKLLPEGAGRSEAGVVFEMGGNTLRLPSVTQTDSGEYSCRQNGKVFSVTVEVADPPEIPILTCHKKSPHLNIQCFWNASQPVSIQTQCYLLVSKGQPYSFSRLACNYSHSLSWCVCDLEHNDEEWRETHDAYLCVTSAAGNATSPMIRFTPMSVIKPDPPSSVEVHGMEGKETSLRVSWGHPLSWKPDRYFKLLYQIRYQVVGSELQEIQNDIEEHSHIINDAMPGTDYMIQVRVKEEYDGHWSSWTNPVYARTLTAQLPMDFTPVTEPDMFYIEGSGADEDKSISPVSPGESEPVWQYVLWITGCCVLLSLAAVAYMFRYKARVATKIRSLCVIAPCTEPPPKEQAPQESHTLMTFTPPHIKETLPNEVEEEEEDNEEREEEEGAEESRGAIHFNNTSYFLVQREC